MAHIRRRSRPSGQVVSGYATGGPQHKLAWPDLGGIRCPDCAQALNRKSINGRLVCRHCGGQFTFTQVQQSINTRGDEADRREKAHRDRLHQLHMNTMEELAESERNQPGLDSTVYYIRFRDAVKVGISINIKRRLSSLPWDEVMALEPGGVAVERFRHAQLKAHGVGGEWFELNDEVYDFIESVQVANVQWIQQEHPHIKYLPSAHATTRFGS